LLSALTDSPQFYDYIGIAAGLLLVLNFLEIVFLLWNKARVERSELKRQELKRLASTALITATAPAELLSRPAAADDYAAYSEAIASVLESFEGEIAERARRLLGELGIDAYYKRLARHRVWYKRGNAVDILASFRLDSNRGFFLDLFSRETANDVKYRLLYGLSRLVRNHADIRELADRLSSLPYLTAKYSEDVFFNVISALKAADKEEEFGLFMKQILADPGVAVLVKRDCLTACFAVSCGKGRPLLKAYFSAYGHEPEILIACVRALSRLGDFSEVPEALRHQDWRVRLAALKYSHMCGTELLPGIRALLHDGNYHVRLNAALALGRTGDTGRSILRLESSSGDTFAAGAAAYALTQEAP
jgi:hypothetical protein